MCEKGFKQKLEREKSGRERKKDKAFLLVVELDCENEGKREKGRKLVERKRMCLLADLKRRKKRS